MSDLIAIRGDTEKYDLTIVDPDGDPVPLTGVSIWFTVKLTQSDPDSAAIVQETVGSGITVTSPSGGTARVTLSSTDTRAMAVRAYYYDVQIKLTDGTITTVESGTLTVQADITRATS